MMVLHTESPLAWGQKQLAELFQLGRQSASVFTADIHDINLNGRVFGGQLLGQALMAARQCCPNKEPATLHCLFLQGARVDLPLQYVVTPLQDGKRFTSLHVAGRQGERKVLDAQVSFQASMAGFFHMEMANDLPGPDELLPMDELPGGAWGRFEKSCLELRIIEAEHYLRRSPPVPAVAYWVRLRHSLPDDPAIHASALAYLSDFWINSAAISYHVPLDDARERLFIASLNHSLWFHQACRADDWLLFVCESASMQGGRGLTQARVYDSSRRLVASIAQDCLVSERQ